jgi:hypothetical protein
MRTFNELINKIHLGVNPYMGFPREQWTVEHWSGWDSHHSWFHESIDRLQPKIIVEVGSFRGGSAIWMAEHLRGLELDSAIVCVDTWLAEKVLWTSAEWRPSLNHRFGRPEFYNTFMANVLDAGLQDYIVPLPMDSTAGANYLKHLNIQSQLIYIDGAHDAAQAYLDLCRYWDEVLLPGGILLVDDVRDDNPDVNGVNNALERFSSERGLNVEYLGRKARMNR